MARRLLRVGANHRLTRHAHYIDRFYGFRHGQRSSGVRFERLRASRVTDVGRGTYHPERGFAPGVFQTVWRFGSPSQREKTASRSRFLAYTARSRLALLLNPQSSEARTSARECLCWQDATARFSGPGQGLSADCGVGTSHQCPPELQFRPHQDTNSRASETPWTCRE